MSIVHKWPRVGWRSCCLGRDFEELYKLDCLFVETEQSLKEVSSLKQLEVFLEGFLKVGFGGEPNLY